jgi:hypothetical protein
MIKIKISDHLLIPFGRPKWDISKIKIVGVSTSATYFQSETPCVYIDKALQWPIVMTDFREAFPQEFSRRNKEYEDPVAAFHFIRSYLKKNCEIQTDAEQRFLDLYFSYILDRVVVSENLVEKLGERWRSEAPRNNPHWLFRALMPLPQAHLYLEDPFGDQFQFFPEKMVKVDFAFWTGTEIVAVEIDGPSHIGNPNHVTKDRALVRAGVHVVHILNNELMEYGEQAINRLLPSLLPDSITRFWRHINEDFHSVLYAHNPLSWVSSRLVAMPDRKE